MHATIDVRFTISIDEAKTIPLATVAEFVTGQNVESVLVEAVVERLDAAASRRSVARNTLTATVTNASNELAPIPAQLSQPPGARVHPPLRQRYSR